MRERKRGGEQKGTCIEIIEEQREGDGGRKRGTVLMQEKLRYTG